MPSQDKIRVISLQDGYRFSYMGVETSSACPFIGYLDLLNIIEHHEHNITKIGGVSLRELRRITDKAQRIYMWRKYKARKCCLSGIWELR